MYKHPLSDLNSVITNDIYKTPFQFRMSRKTAGGQNKSQSIRLVWSKSQFNSAQTSHVARLFPNNTNADRFQYSMLLKLIVSLTKLVSTSENGSRFTHQVFILSTTLFHQSRWASIKKKLNIKWHGVKLQEKNQLKKTNIC